VNERHGVIYQTAVLEFPQQGYITNLALFRSSTLIKAPFQNRNRYWIQ
jgi:hypothetical protein